MRPLDKLFWDELGEMLHIKEMLLKSMFRMDSAVRKPEFKEAIRVYRNQVKDEAEELKEVFRAFEMPARAKKCDGMMGVLLKGQQIMLRTGPGPALDAALLCLCRKITAYNLESYLSLSSWAKLGMGPDHDAVAVLQKLSRDEMEAVLRFARLTAECDREAADQDASPPPRPAASSRLVAKEPSNLARARTW